MSKRFTDTNKWNKPFIRGLQGVYKLLWIYITDDCNHAGIWQVDTDVAEIKIGEEIDWDKAISIFGDKIHVFSNGEKWFIPDFISFQYGELNPVNRVHNSVLQELNKYNIKALVRGLQGCKDKDKDKDKEGGVGETNNELCFYNPKELYEEMIKSQEWINYILMSSTARKNNLKQSDINDKIIDFIRDQQIGENLNRSFGVIKRHFWNQLKNKLEQKGAKVGNHV